MRNFTANLRIACIRTILFALLLFTFGYSNLYAQTISGTVNEYAAVNSTSGSVVTVTNSGDISGWNPGDKILLIQMKGTVIDETNSSSYGDIISFDGAGNYEFNTIASVSGADITLSFPICKTYNFSLHPVQVIRVPVYTNVTINGEITGQAWDGTTGGVIALEATGTITMSANINAEGLGFRGGDESVNADSAEPDLYVCDITSGKGGIKGEGIVEIPGAACRGKQANGGGGGNDHNSGGGGGGNYGAGGQGGDGWPNETNEGGVGGVSLSTYYSEGLPRLFLGGGGGGGHQNNGATAPASDGGGIVFLTANTLNITGSYAINANAPDAVDITINDGAGGGGAGGSILLEVNNFTNPTNLTLNVSGGDGGSITTGDGHGPGGGGGGGFIHTSVTLTGVITNVSGGQPGVFIPSGGGSSSVRNAAAGGDGVILQGNLSVQVCSDPPVLDLDNTSGGNDYAFTFTEGDPATPVASSGNVDITDSDDVNMDIAVFTLTNPQDGANEYLLVDDAAAILATYGITTTVSADNYSITMTSSEPIADYEFVLGLVKYENVSNVPDETNRVVEVVVNDGGANSNVATSTITVVSVNSIPQLDLDASEAGTGYAATFQKGRPAVNIADDDTEITDGDGTTLVRATITLTNRLNGSNESLSVNGSLPAGITVTNTYDNTDGILELSGTASLADYQTAIEQIQYNNNSINPNNENRIITVVVNDGTDDSNTATTTLSVKFPPTLSAIGPVETTTEETQVEIDFLEINDNSDAMDADGEVTAFVVQNVVTGTLKIGASEATATPYAPGTNDVVSAELGLKAFWTPDTNDSGTLSAFTVFARDNEGFESNEEVIVPVIVNEINDLPVANDDTGSTNEATSVTLANITSNDTDVDGTIDPSSIILIDPSDFLNTGDKYNPLVIAGEGTYSVNENGDLTFLPDASFTGTAQVNYTVADDDKDRSNEASVTITVTGNTPPVLDLDANNGSGATGFDYQTRFLDGTVGDIVADTDVKITDADDTFIESVTITLTNRPDGINEQLSVNGTLPPNITVTDAYSDSDGKLVLSGSSELDDYQNVLKIIRYTNASATPDLTDRVIQIVVNDGTADSNVAISTLSVGCSSFPQYTFDEATTIDLVSGTAGAVGAVYRFHDIDRGVNSLDALVELTGIVNCTLLDIDDNSGNVESFRPLIDWSGSGSTMYVDWKITLVLAGTTTPVNISNIAMIGADVDGYTTCRDFVGYIDSPGITLEQNNNITRDFDDPFTTFQSSNDNDVTPGDTDEPLHTVYGTFENTSVFRVRGGTISPAGDDDGERLVEFDLYNTCFFNNYTTPKTTPNSASKTIVLNEDQTFAFSNVDFSFSDADGDDFEAIVIKELPDNGTLRYNGSPVTQTNVNNGTEYGSRDSFSFQPDANENGNPYTNFIFQVKDDSNHPDTEFAALVDTITFKIFPLNDPPVAENDLYTVSEGGTITVDDADGTNTGATTDDGVLVIGTPDSDVDGDNLTVSLITGPSYNGADFTLNPDGTFVYVHDGSENHTDSFVYEISDGNGETDQATVTITITPVNDPPVLDLDGNNSSGAVAYDYFTGYIEGGDPVAIADIDDSIEDADDTNIESVTIILTNRPDGTNESLALKSGYTLPVSITETDAYDNADGQIVFSGSATKAEYEEVIRNIVYANSTVDPDVADRNITVVVNDGDQDSNVAIANVTVSNDDDFDRDGVLDKDDLDDDNDGIPDTAEFCAQGGFGCLPGGLDPSGDQDTDGIPNYLDPDVTSLGSCTITGSSPLCDEYDTDDDGIPNHLDLNSDGDSCADAYEAGHDMTVLTGGIIAGPYGANGLANSVETSAESGSINYTVSESQAGTFDAQNGSYDTCNPQLDLDDDDSSTATVADYLTSFTEGDIDVRIGDNDVIITDANDVKIESATIILTNRPDGTSETLSIEGTLPPGISVSDPYNNNDGQLVLTGSAALSSYQAAIEQIVYNNTSLNPDNTQRVVTVVVNDGDSDSNFGTTRINIIPVNANPVAINDTNTITEGTVSVNHVNGNGELDANDIDTDGDALTISAIGSETNPAVNVTGTYGYIDWQANGRYDYYLDNAAVNHLAQGETVQETFTYTVTDGIGSDQAVLTITITGSNDNPVAADDINQINNSSDDTVNETDGSGNLLANDTDVDGDGLYVASMRSINLAGVAENDPGNDVTGQYGFINWATDGTYVYDVDEANGAVSGLAIGETLTEVFDYIVSDANGVDTGRLTITITNGDAEIRITASDNQGAEPGSDDGEYTVTLYNNLGVPILAPRNITVNYAVSGTATSGSDYTALTGTVTIPTNSLSVTIPLDVLDDALAECSDESVIVTLLGTSDVELGSPSVATVTILDDEDISPTITIADVCDGDDAVVAISGATELPNGTYDFDYTVTGVGSFTATGVSITSGAGSFSVSGLASGTREIDVTGTASPCSITSNSAPVQFNVNSGSSSASLSGTTSVCKGETANLSITITGGQSPYTVSLSDGSSITGYTSGAPIPVSPASTTTYTITSIADANGCMGTNNSGSATVTVNRGSTAATVSGATSICAGQTTNLTVAITGGTSPYTVVLNGVSDPIVNYTSGSNIPVSPTVTTSYTIASITDANGCVGTGNAATATVTITNSHSIDSQPASNITACVDETTQLSVSASGAEGNLTYQWQSSTDNVSFSDVSGANASTYVVPTASAGTTYYRVQVGDDESACDDKVSEVSTVEVVDKPTATISGGGFACPGDVVNISIALTGNQPWSVTYTDGTTPTTVNGITSSPYTFTAGDAATYTVTAVSDVNCSGTFSGSAVVTNDTTNPTASNPSTTNVECDADIPAVDVLVVTDESDNCTANPTVAFVGEVTDGGSNPETITRTYSVTDAAGNSITVTHTIIVNDVTDPVITSCPSNITQDTDAGESTAVVTYTLPTFTDNCGATINQISGLSSGSAFPIGTTTNTFEVTDGAGNTATCSFDVTVEDNESPEITCPGDITTGVDAGNCSAVVNYTPPVGTDNAPGSSTTQIAGLPSGSVFPVGTTTNTFEVTDASGNTATCSFDVVVEDNESPTASNPSTTNVECDADIPAVDVLVVTDESDNCTANPTVAFVGAGNSITVVNDVTDGGSNPETITRTYSVTDAAGNSITVTHTIIVNDVTDQCPGLVDHSVITCLGQYRCPMKVLRQHYPGYRCRRIGQL